MYNFTYQRPTTVTEAVAAARAAADGQFLAGGMTIIPTLKQRLAMPSDLIDVGGIAELAAISREGAAIVVGALATHDTVADHPMVRNSIPGLADLAARIGDPQVRNRATIGGSIATNDPSGDYPAAILALDATIHTDRRQIAADAFFTGMFETALADDELITRIGFPIPEMSSYVKFTKTASHYPIVGVMVAKSPRGVRVVVTGAGPGVFRVAEMEAALADDFSAAALDGPRVSADTLNTDMHASAEYRAHLITVMAKRAVTQAS